MPESRIFSALERLLVCLEENLPAPVCSLTVQAGEAAAFDFGMDCEYDGMGWVRMISAWPFRLFPEPLVGTLPDTAWSWGYSIEMGVVRSYPMDEDGNPQLGDELIKEKARAQIADMRAMMMALLCCFEPVQISVAPYEPLGPEGGACGGQFQFSVKL